MKRFLVLFCIIVGLLGGCNSEIETDTSLQQELGFRHGTPYYNVNGEGTEVMDVSFVQSQGVFAKAGFKAGDIFLDLRNRNSISELYALLEASRGKTITLRVVPGGNGFLLEQRPIKNITFVVPSKARNSPTA